MHSQRHGQYRSKVTPRQAGRCNAPALLLAGILGLLASSNATSANEQPVRVLTRDDLAGLSLEQLGNIMVTSVYLLLNHANPD